VGENLISETFTFSRSAFVEVILKVDGISPGATASYTERALIKVLVLIAFPGSLVHFNLIIFLESEQLGFTCAEEVHGVAPVLEAERAENGSLIIFDNQEGRAHVLGVFDKGGCRVAVLAHLVSKLPGLVF